jgi:tetratricopeptide (TPR) repeat protein
VNGLVMPANSSKDWVQAFGYFAGEPARVHDQDYARACAYVDDAIKQQMSTAHLDALLASARAHADGAPERILAAASGWGALERMRRAGEPTLPPVPAAFDFPMSTLTSDQERWVRLLQEGHFPDQNPTLLPGEWLVQPEWLDKLAAVAPKGWFALLHEGVMCMEAGETDAAVAAWQRSIALQPSTWACRNLAVAAMRAGDDAAAQALYQQAWDLAVTQDVMVPALAVECLQALVAQKKYVDGQALYDALPPELRDVDRIQLLRGRIALELGDLDTVEEVLQREFAVIQEGETETSDLWVEMWMRREAARTGRALDAALRREVRQKWPLPENIDFLMFVEK